MANPLMDRRTFSQLLAMSLAAAATPGYCTEEEEDVSEYNDYYIGVTLDQPFEEAKARAIDAFKAQGFGRLTEIDLQGKFKEKLDKDVPKYVILGVCAPGLAYRAWEADPRVGVLLPCTVVVRELEEGKSEVLINSPDSLAQFSSGVVEVLDDVKAKVDAVVTALKQ